MNDRMTELYAKACLDARDIHPTDVPAFIACMAEKLSELIVRMCADAADMAQDADCDYVGDYVAEYMGYGQPEGVTEWRAKQ